MSLYRGYFVLGAVDPLGREMTIAECQKEKTSVLNDGSFADIIDFLNRKPCKMPQIACKCCEIKAGGFYDPKTKNVTICANHSSKGSIKSTIIHELIHAFDDCTVGLIPPKGTHCYRLACSEVRASSSDGSCNEGGRGRKRNETRKECVERRAKISTRRAKCGNRHVDHVLDKCYICETCSSPAPDPDGNIPLNPKIPLPGVMPVDELPAD
jgi:hypothetical protein